MRIVKRGRVWIAVCPFEEKDVAKGAGFRWHNPQGGQCRSGCLACEAQAWKCWWTDDVGVAAKLAKFADPACLPELTGAAQARVESEAASRAGDANVAIPAPAGLEYKPFQRAGIAYAAARQSTLIADEMGLGKTIQALGLVNLDAAVRTVLVLCPATLRLNWEREARKWLVRSFNVHVVEGREIPPPEADFVIVNYDKLVGEKGAPLREALLARKWDVLVSDEAHYLKNPKAQRTQALLGKKSKVHAERRPGLIESARRRLFLTGTPIMNRPIEVHPLLSALAPSEFGNFWKFAQRYCDAKQVSIGYRGGSAWDFTGASNLEELQQRMRQTCMVRRLKSEVQKELPPKCRQVIAIPAEGKAARAVKAEADAWAQREERMAEARKAAAAARAEGNEAAYREAVAALQDAVQVAFEEIAKLRHDVAVAKIPYVIEHVEGLLDEGLGKVVVFAHHHDVIDALAEKWKGEVVVLDGRTPMAERQAAVDRFQADQTCRVFVGGIKAAGVGITLTASSTVVMAELDWTPAAITQAEDRCHRIGQANTVLVQHVVFDGSLDARIAQVAVAKQEIAEKALDAGAPVRAAEEPAAVAF